MNDLEVNQLEKLCQDFYSSSNEQVISTQQRNSSGQALQSYLESPGNFRRTFSVLTISRNTQLLYLSSSALTKLLAAEWKSFSTEEKQMMYNSLLTMMINSQDMPGFLIGGVSKLLARICRFGWNEIEEIKQITSRLESIIMTNGNLIFFVFRFYEELINEISEPVKGRSLSLSRKIAVGFRDDGLGKIFSFCLRILSSQIQSLSGNCLTSILTVMNLCMNFDFLGVSSDETSEDTVCLQIPVQWKSHFENPVFFGLLQFIIFNSEGEVETLALRIFNHVGAVRKSIFSGSLEIKNKYIVEYLKASEALMGLNKFEGDSLFEFIQALKRFLSNFGIKEVAECENFENWLKVFANYSIHLFRRPESISSGIESSMLVWSFLASEAHLQLSSNTQLVSQFVSALFQTFLDCTLVNASVSCFDSSKESDLKDHIEMISNFSIYYYVEVAKILENVFVGLVKNLQFSEREQAKLTWVILIASGYITIRDNKSSDVHINLDAMMVQTVFEAMSKFPNPCECLQMSFLMFFIGLSKAYINSSYEKLWVVLDPSQSCDDTINRVLTSILEICFKHLSLSSSQRLTKSALELFELLSRGYYSNKYLIKNELIQNLMLQYKTFPLCVHDAKLRYRVFNSLTHLWVNEDLSIPIETFLAPMNESLQKLSESPNSRDFELVFKELEGICFALQNQKAYLEFFEWFYFRFGVVVTACQHFLYETSVMDAMLSFVAELVYSRNSRIKFDLASSYGIVIFKNVSSVIVGYANVIIENRNSPELFKKFYSKIRKMMSILTSFLSGGFVNFGVFEVYNDTCFVECLQLMFTILESIPKSEILVKVI